MEYPIIFDKTAETFTGSGLGILDCASSLKIREVVNGEYTLNFVVPHKDELKTLVCEENFVVVEGQAFRIRTFETVRDNVGKIISNVQCEHVSYDLNDIKHLPRMKDIVNVTPDQIFNTGFSDDENSYSGIFDGTAFTLTSVVSGSTDLFLYKTSPRAVLNQFLEDLSCEAIYDNRQITLVPQRGQNSGVSFRAGKNLKTIKRLANSKELITRLYPYGKDYLDITSVNSRLAYVDSPLINLYDYVHEGYMDFTDIDEPGELKDKAMTKWSTEDKDGIDKPKVTYEAAVAELKKLDEFGAFERFELGDTIRIVDEMLGIDVNARIMEYEYYPYEPQRSAVVLANFKENIGGVFAELLKAKNLVEQIVTNSGQVNDAFIESVRQTMQMKFNSALTKKTVVHDFADVWVDDVNNPTAAIALVDGMFALANKKKPDGTWDWRTIGDSGRLIADEVVASWVYAGAIQANQITAGTLNTSLINVQSSNGRLKIEGDKIYMADKTASPTVTLEMTPQSGIYYTHEYDVQGRKKKSTYLNYIGAGMEYHNYLTPTSQSPETWYHPYVNCVHLDTLGGTVNDSQIYVLNIPGPGWLDQLYEPKVMVTPAETLRFVEYAGGRLNDISQYRCTVHDVYRSANGLTVEIESWKTYVSRISGNNPTYTTGSLRFNVLVIMANCI